MYAGVYRRVGIVTVPTEEQHKLELQVNIIEDPLWPSMFTE